MTAHSLALFTRQVLKTKKGCWNWTGVINRSGYGHVTIMRKQRGAHRVFRGRFTTVKSRQGCAFCISAITENAFAPIISGLEQSQITLGMPWPRVAKRFLTLGKLIACAGTNLRPKTLELMRAVGNAERAKSSI